MNGFAAILLKPLIEVIGKQFDEQVEFIRLKITGRNPVDGKPAFGFFDVIFHAAALVVEPPQIDRFPLEVGDDRFVLPVRIKDQACLAVIHHLRFADDRDTTGLFPRRCFVDERYAFDDLIFIIDIAFPISTGGNFCCETFRPLQLADVADSSALPQSVEVFASESFVKSGVLHRTLVDEVEPLLQEGGSVCGGMRIACPEYGIQAQARSPFKSQQGMVAFPAGLMRIRSFGRTGLIAIHGLHRGVQIQNQFGRQTGPNDVLIDSPQIQRQVRTGLAQSHPFFV